MKLVPLAHLRSIINSFNLRWNIIPILCVIFVIIFVVGYMEFRLNKPITINVSIADIVKVYEDEFIHTASETYIVDKDLMTAIRKLENGRRGLEFGVMNIPEFITETYPEEQWQYQAAARIVAYAERDFCEHYRTKFTQFLGKRYCPINPKWGKDVLYLWEEEKKK